MPYNYGRPKEAWKGTGGGPVSGYVGGGGGTAAAAAGETTIAGMSELNALVQSLLDSLDSAASSNNTDNASMVESLTTLAKYWGDPKAKEKIIEMVHELKKTNIQLANITNEEIHEGDVDDT
jgi:hypothetical protein